MPRLILFVTLLFGVSYVSAKWFKGREILASWGLGDVFSESSVHPHNPGRNMIVRRSQTQVIERRRQRAKAGISSYLDWHYSVSGSLTEQLTVVARGMRSLRAQLRGQPARPSLVRERAQAQDQRGVHDQRSAVSEEDLLEDLSRLIQQRLHDHIFCHLTEWTDEDFRALVREVRGEGRLLVSLFNQKVVQGAIDQLRSQEIPIYTFKSGLPSEVKLGVSSVVALGSATLMYQSIQKISAVISRRLARRAMVTAMYRGGVVLSGAEGAAAGAVGCTAGGLFGVAACAIGGFTVGVLVSEWGLNRVDEWWSRAALEHELHDQIDIIFDKFERATTRSILEVTRGFFDRDRDPKELRLIDLFE